MVQFKKVFLGMEEPPDGKRRATTSQKCVRAGGKHNDLEQVGHTARHHTFFEMLGNFSFGDYFKRDAIRFAWEFVTNELEARSEACCASPCTTPTTKRARSGARSPACPTRASTGSATRTTSGRWRTPGPCGPCSEIFVDLAHVAQGLAFPDGATGEWTEIDREEFSLDAFVEGAEAGRFLEFWNLVFMQFDRQPDGTLVPLPKPSVDTGAGLERIAAITQGVTMNYHTDLFAPLLAAVEQAVGIAVLGTRERRAAHRRADSRRHGRRDVVPNAVDPASFRVLADHARAVAFLLADGVFPSNEGRGYVLRRILRRAVRHAWLLGRKEPTLVARRAGGHRLDGRRVSGAAPARRSTSSTRRASRSRASSRRSRAGSRASSSSRRCSTTQRRRRTCAARSAARTRSGSTTRSAFRSISRS